MKKNSFVNGLMLPFLLAFIIALLIGNFVYIYASKKVSQMTLKSNESMLRLAQISIEERFASINNFLVHISKNPNLPYFAVERNLNGEAYYYIWKFRNDLAQASVNEASIKDVYVYFYNNDAVVTTTTAYYKSYFYDKYFRFGDLDFDEFRSLMKNTYYESNKLIKVAEFKTETTSFHALAYINTIPVNVAQKGVACIMVIIDEQKLVSHLKQMNLFDTGYAYVLDEKGEVIISALGEDIHPVFLDNLPDSQKPFTQNINGTEMTFVSHTSETTGWQYIAAVPTKKLLSQAKLIQLFTITGSLSSLIIGLAVAYFLLKQRMTPLSKAMGKLISFYPDNSYVRSPFVYVGEKIEALVEDNYHFKNRTYSTIRMLKQLCVSSVLRGDCSSMSEPLAQIGMLGKKYNAIVMVADKVFPPEWYISTLNEYKSEQFNGNVVFIHHKENTFFALMSHNYESLQMCTEQANSYIRNLKDSLLLSGANCIFYVGRIYSELTEVVLSFYEACDLNSSSIISDNGIVWYNHHRTKGITYNYPVEIEARLIENIRTGKTDAVSSLMDKIYDDNFRSEMLSSEIAKGLFYELLGTMIKVNPSNRNKLIIDTTTDYQAFFNTIKDEFLKVCIEFKERLQQNEDMGTKMMRFINENSHDPNLSLRSLADAFGLSESYVSKYFKESTGENFRTYLERIRINHSIKLLEKGCLTVKEIATQVGYLDDKSFRRAYKRLTGFTPLESVKKSTIEILIS
jgi:two-component system response regulator YesN